MRTIVAFVFLAAGCTLSAQSNAAPNDSDTWNPKAAAAYLDQRAEWWTGWSMSVRDHETFCISCHTALPYALARPALRADLSEKQPSPVERKLIDNVTRRVRMWQEVEPFYTDAKSGAPKSLESRGTESVLNALILTRSSPAGELSDDARMALDNMWALQLKSGETAGALPWLNFHNEPWEADDSQYWGNTLAAIAVGSAPTGYRALPDTQEHVRLLAAFLQKSEATQTLLNRLSLLWASTKLPGLLVSEQRESIAADVMRAQQDDGGWAASSLVVKTWKRRDNTPLEARSDGFATGLIAFVFSQAKSPATQGSEKRALAWWFAIRTRNRVTGRRIR